MDAVALLRGELPAWTAGYGSGDGSGYGSGDGSGYGDGDGYGDGSGYGYGDGDGDGSGSGYGSGDGAGDGSGSGYGYGCGDGDGYGSGDGSYWLATLAYFGKKWTDAQRARLGELQQLGAKIAFWWSDETGYACNGGNRTVQAVPGAIEKISGPLKICTPQALHATELPPKWKGQRIWCVALLGELQQQDDKFAALEREIIGECE